MQVAEQESVLMSKDEILDKIRTLTGGRAAEEFMFNICTSGASNDIEQATRLARAMVAQLGMSRSVRHDGAGNGEQPVSERRRFAGLLE